MKKIFFFAGIFVFLFVYFLFAGGSNTFRKKEITYEDVEVFFNKAKELINGTSKESEFLRNLQEVVEKRKKEGAREAEVFYQKYKSEEFQKKVDEWRKTLLNTFGAGSLNEFEVFKKTYRDFNQERKGKEKEKQIRLEKEETIYIFVSSSMPREALRRYVLDASTLIEGKVYFVLRGGINGLTRLKPTVSFVAELLKKDPDCDFTEKLCEMYEVEFWVEPILFREYEVKVVPAVLYHKEGGVSVLSPGAVSLKRHLQRIGETLKDKRFL